MSFINHAEKKYYFDQQIDQIENEIRSLQATLPADDGVSMPAELAGLLDDLFIQLHTIITLKCVTMIDPKNILIVDALKNQQSLNVMEVAKLTMLMSNQIELLYEGLAQLGGDIQSDAMLKQTIAEFFIGRQALVDTAINDSSEADNFCECITCQQVTYHQFTARFDYVCTQCETSFFN